MAIATVMVALVIERARQQMRALTGQPVACVVSCVQEGEGWRVVLETLERKAIPDSADILAIHSATLDADGNILGFQRLRTRRRGQPVEDREI
ncbi:MAG: gas vesicle protein [Chloroflexi bacterium]|nr:gas vesicle protein [Chloroflexota bacterium]